MALTGRPCDDTLTWRHVVRDPIRVLHPRIITTRGDEGGT
jgi:hypothetical protein